MSKFEYTKVAEFCNTPRSVKELATQFQVTAITVRKHLISLVSLGVLVNSGLRTSGGRGRPTRLFTVNSTKTT